jgi:DNA-binding NarL/FixJ family response regulator
MVLGLLSDLFFSARIRETARQLALPCDIVRDPEALLARVAKDAPTVIIVDMNLKTGDAAAAVRSLRASHADLRIVGYLYDSQEELMLAAEEAGCDRVLSRGQLTRMLPDLLSGKVPIAEKCH